MDSLAFFQRVQMSPGRSIEQETTAETGIQSGATRMVLRSLGLNEPAISLRHRVLVAVGYLVQPLVVGAEIGHLGRTHDRHVLRGCYGNVTSSFLLILIRICRVQVDVGE